MNTEQPTTKLVYKPTIALDFDGVLHEYTGWNGGKLNGPLPGALEAVYKLLENGFDLKIFSTRNKDDIDKWLLQYGFPGIQVCKEKPLSIVLIDDRAVTFNGIWSEDFIDSIKKFKAYWEK